MCEVLAEGAAGILRVEPASSSAAKPSFLRCLQPYRHAHSTSTKGRWLRKPLLEVFAREFAVVGELNGLEVNDVEAGAASIRSPTANMVCMDPIVNAFLYAQELVDGTLYIEKQEDECVRAGKEYLTALEEIDPMSGRKFRSVEEREASFAATPRTLEAMTKALSTCRPRAEADADAFFAALPQLLVLKQSHRFVHIVNRAEHSVNLTEGPIEVAHIARSSSSSPTPAPAFIALSKPSSIGIHPAGRFQKNTLLKVVEDMFNCAIPVNKGGAARRSQEGSLLFGLLIKTSEEVDVDSNGSEVKKQCTDIYEPLFQCSGAGQRQSGAPQAAYCLCQNDDLATSTAGSASASGHRYPVRFAPVPTIRIPHSKVSHADRMWLLAKLLPKEVHGNPITNGDGASTGANFAVINAPSPHGNRLLVFDSKSLLDEIFEFQERGAACGSGGCDGIDNSFPGALKLFIVHRLDRCTSGIILLALDARSATAITNTLSAGEKDGDEVPNENEGSAAASAHKSGWTFTASGARVVTNTSCDTTKRNKQYLAKVHGDMRSLFWRLEGAPGTQSECDNCRESVFVQTILPADSDDGVSKTVIANGAIYCSSYQLASYWCLSPEEQRRYESFLHRSAEENTRGTLLGMAHASKRERAATSVGNDHGAVASQEGTADAEGLAKPVHCVETSMSSERLSFSGVKEARGAMWERVYGRRTINGATPLSDSDVANLHPDLVSEAEHFAKFAKLRSAVSSLTLVAVTKTNGLGEEVHLPTSGPPNELNADSGTFYSYVACTPHTGRTHQLRIHLAAAGFPIVLDDKYSSYLQKLRDLETSEDAPTSAEESIPLKPGEAPITESMDPEIICLHAHTYTFTISSAGDDKDTTAKTVVTAEAPRWYLGPRNFASIH